MNFIIVVGRITKDIQLKYTPSNKAIVEFTMAVNNSKDDTTFIKLTAFGKTAELISKYCTKGDLIGAESIVKNHNWEDKQGNKHYEYTFIVNKVSFLAKGNKEAKKQDNTSIFEEFGEQLEIDTDKLLD